MAKPPLRPPGRRGGTTTLLTWTLLLLLAAAAQAQSPSIQYASTRRNPPIQSTENVDHTPSRRPQPGRSPAEIPLLKHDVATVRFRSTDDNTDNHKFYAVAPAQEISAVRAPLAQSPESPSGLSALPSARLLQDWEAENIVLLATIDGLIHARDRKTGQERWSLGIPDSPMIQTIHHCENQTDDEDAQCERDYIFIVEPSKDGNLYIQHKDPRLGLQRLGITVRSLAAETPQFVEEPPLVTIAEQETTAYVIDAASGNILQQFNKQSAFVNDNARRSCRRLSGFELDDPSCEPFGTLNLGRVEYTIRIANKLTSESLCTIKFAEWVPNKGDSDLQEQYMAPLDNYHIQTYYNGRIIGLDTNSDSGKFHQYTHMLDTPVARVFDVVRPLENEDRTARLVLLSRPTDAAPLSSTALWNDMQRAERVFVNRTEAGMWYAMSELSYPGITTGANPANTRWKVDTGFLDLENDVQDLVGVHHISPDQSTPSMRLTISGPPAASELLEDTEKAMTALEQPRGPALFSRIGSDWSFLLNVILISIFVLVAGIQMKVPFLLKLQRYLRKAGVEIVVDASRPKSSSQVSSPIAADVPHTETEPAPAQEKVSEVVAEMVETATATPARSRSQSVAALVVSPKKTVKPEEMNENSSDGDSDEELSKQDSKSGDPDNGSEPRRRHVKRGKRGGKKNKKNKKTMDPETMDENEAMVPEVPTKDGLVQVGRLRIDTRTNSCLGNGSNGTFVFPGTLDGREVAVKRLIRSSNSLAAKEIKHLLSSDENPHVIRYFGKEESQHFTYIALERFTTSLDQFLLKHEEFPDLVKMPEGFDVKDCLRQITDGVQHLHSLKLVHRDIKPQNVLVKAVKSSRPTTGLPKLQFVISDFGLAKPLDDGAQSTFAPTANHTAAGTTGWRAPELLVNARAAVAAPNAVSSTSKSTTHSNDGTVIDPPTGRRATKAIDIFSLGCVFYYVMSWGQHPFDVGGTSLGRDLNIKENKFDTSHLRLMQYTFEAEDLVMQMIKHEPKDRPDTIKILRHPYFWDDTTKVEFLVDVSDAYEREKNSITELHNPLAPRTPQELKSLAEIAALESLACNVFTGNDFTKALPRSFLNEMGKQRKYTGSKMIDLLRVIRNKKNHFHDLPEDIKIQMGGTAQGYYKFWADRFPSLLINCHCCVLERGLVESMRLERYFE